MSFPEFNGISLKQFVYWRDNYEKERKNRRNAHDYSPSDDTIANEVRHHQPVHLMKSHSVIRWKRQELPFHWHTNHRAYAHVPDATNQIDGYVDLFHGISIRIKTETTNKQLENGLSCNYKWVLNNEFCLLQNFARNKSIFKWIFSYYNRWKKIWELNLNSYPWSLGSRRRMLSMDPMVSLNRSCPNGRPLANIHRPFLSSSLISMIVCDFASEFLLFSSSMVDSPIKQRERKNTLVTKIVYFMNHEQGQEFIFTLACCFAGLRSLRHFFYRVQFHLSCHHFGFYYICLFRWRMTFCSTQLSDNCRQQQKQRRPKCSL